MNNNDMILIVIIIASHLFVLVLGTTLSYLVLNKQQDNYYEKPKSFLKSQSKEKENKSLEIDDTKVVLNIRTDGYEKKFDNMTKDTKIHNNITNSVNKLKNMKGK